MGGEGGGGPVAPPVTTAIIPSRRKREDVSIVGLAIETGDRSWIWSLRRAESVVYSCALCTFPRIIDCP